MKIKGLRVLCACLVIFLCSACGMEKNEVYYDIEVSTEKVFGGDVAQWGFFCVGAQFYGEEPLRIWVEQAKGDNESAVLNVYLQRVDGSMEPVLKNVDAKYRAIGWHMAMDGSFYIPMAEGITKLDSRGEVIFETREKISIKNICELEEGKIIVSFLENNVTKLAWLKPETGELIRLDNLMTGEMMFWLGSGKKGLYLMNTAGLWSVDPEALTKEKILSFYGTSYLFAAESESGGIADFIVREGESVQLLRMGGVKENLKLVDVGTDREILKIRMADSVRYPWFANRVVEFNQKNEEYYIVIEQCGEGEDVWDFRMRTGVQVAAGKGADIIMGSAVIGETQSFLEKGIFENLAPYMERSGIREEDYFPMTFDCWREQDKVYGVQPLISLRGGFAIEKSLLGEKGEPELEKVLESLLSFDEEAVLKRHYTQEMVLEYFLQGSEELWGTVDWENGCCDFGGELFRKIMKVAKRYGDREEGDVKELAASRNCGDFYSYDTGEDMEGRVILGFFFDDGCHAAIANNFVMAINAGSKNKEAAWEFLSSLLEEEKQRENGYGGKYPASRAAFWTAAEKEMEDGVRIVEVNPDTGKVTVKIKSDKYALYRRKGYTAEESEELCRVTLEKAQEIVEIIERAKPFPVKTEPLLDIICAEAQDYFNDAKSLEEVTAVIENRVGLYLREKR